MNSKTRGFTLIELVIVIVVLSLLAVMAVTRYVDAISDARKGLLNAIAGTLESAVVLVHMKARLSGATTGTAATVTVQKGKGTTATVLTTVELVPEGTVAGIGDGLHASNGALDLGDVFSRITVTAVVATGGVNSMTYAIASTTNCKVVYTETIATGVIAITKTESGC